MMKPFITQNMVYEELHTYGGTAGRDMSALAIGIKESVPDTHIRARVGQAHYLDHQIELCCNIIDLIGKTFDRMNFNNYEVKQY